ncbi:MAG: AmmeMemoRadiSam system protein B [Candidatus Micrarchaeota archaeon]|nr:AmmeMemoRadiSam system protein B [Candidatus Micrarchaeota archaeon]
MRNSAFAGSFYPSDSKELLEFVSNAVSSADIDSGVATGVKSYVAPHAGYVYSGKPAACTYKLLKENAKELDTIVLVGPNHTGMGKAIAISTQDWKTPLGVVNNDVELAKVISEQDSFFSLDEAAHREEHSLEVELPFIQHVAPGTKAVFICMANQGFESSMSLATSIVVSAKQLGRRITVIASSDLNHYEPAAVAKRKDEMLFESIRKLDVDGFYRAVKESEDSACGYGPIAVSLLFARSKGAIQGEILKYSNSGDETGDYESVVSYASIAFK